MQWPRDAIDQMFNAVQPEINHEPSLNHSNNDNALTTIRTDKIQVRDECRRISNALRAIRSPWREIEMQWPGRGNKLPCLGTAAAPGLSP